MEIKRAWELIKKNYYIYRLSPVTISVNKTTMPTNKKLLLISKAN